MPCGKIKRFCPRHPSTEGLRCNTCHFPTSPEGHDSIMGTGAPGHSLSVGPQVCGRCHEESVHKSSQLVDIRKKFSETQKHMAVAGVTSVFELNEKVKRVWNGNWIERDRARGWWRFWGFWRGLDWAGLRPGLLSISPFAQKMNEGITRRRSLFKGAIVRWWRQPCSSSPWPRQKGLFQKATYYSTCWWISRGASDVGPACADASAPMI
jgi:hypothetical protein